MNTIAERARFLAHSEEAMYETESPHVRALAQYLWPELDQLIARVPGSSVRAEKLRAALRAFSDQARKRMDAGRLLAGGKTK